MKRKYAIFFLLAVVFALSGCAGKNNADSNSNQDKLSNDAQENTIAGQRWNENFSEASSTILAIGQKVFITGEENSDGSILAQSIIVSNSNANWDELMKNERPQQKMEDDGQTGQIPSAQVQGGRVPDFSQFQNLSDDEKQKLREQRTAQGGIEKKISGEIRQSMTQLNGEIISKSDNNFIVKIENVGSKLIFFSDSSRILTPKQAI